MLTATLPDKQQTLWLHGNTLLKPMHSVIPPNPNHTSSEYAEVTQIMPILKTGLVSAPPEPYATVTLQRGVGGGGAQSDDSCVKCSASPSSSEYNAPVREPLNICDVLPPPPDHPPSGYYKPPNMASMTIRTNPVAMSPQICRRQGGGGGGVTVVGQRWPTLPPPVPRFPQNWQDISNASVTAADTSFKRNQRTAEIEEEENDYESGSVLYEECEQAKNFFNYGGEPTEEYYRNINMEYLDEINEVEPPPDPCPDTLPKNRTKHSGSAYSGQSWLGNSNQQSSSSSPQNNPSASNDSSSISYDDDPHKLRNDQSPVNGRRTMRNNTPLCNTANSNQASSDESECDNNRWPARFHRSRSKSGDRKFRSGR